MQPNTRVLSCLLSCAVAIALAPRARGDEINMTNGDCLTGQVVTMQDKSLALSTEYAGDIDVDWEQVASLRLDEPLPAVLADGREVEVSDLPAPDIALADIAAIAPPAPAPPPPVLWQGRVDFGWAQAGGNRDTQLGTLTAFAERDDPQRYRLSLLLDSARGSSEGEDTANRARVEGKYDRRAGDHDYRYWLAGLGYDRVRSMDSRLEVGSGVGRTLLDKPGHVLTAEIGASFVRDEFADGSTQADAKLRLGETWFRKFATTAEVRQSLALLVAADELSDYTGEAVLALTHRLSKRLSLTAKLVSSYDSRPALGTKRSDHTISTQLGMTFGK